MTPLKRTPTGSVEAPAGCGKTFAIVEQVSEPSTKPSLILTHTNAGIVALRERLHRANTPRSGYRLYTIDAWCQRIVRAFPMRAQYTFEVTEAIDYSQIKLATLEVLKSGALTRAFSATYGLVLVDEYQDCDTAQHAIITELALRVPTRVYGDPMQAIFDFEKSVVAWPDVQSIFPALPGLSTPWRWKRTGCDDLGRWLLDVRSQIQDGNAIDLSKAPSRHVRWQCAGEQAGQMALKSIKIQEHEKLLIIGSATKPGTRHEFARRNFVSVVERADYVDLTSIVKKLVSASNEHVLSLALKFAGRVMTGANVSRFKQRIESLKAGTAKNAASHLEGAALNLLSAPTPKVLYRLLELMVAQPTSRLFRPELYYVLSDALLISATFEALPRSVSIVRDKRRFGGRPLPRRAIGSTLLLKGLEAEHALVLSAEELTGPHLYVALSRGSKTLSVVSPSNLLSSG